MATYSFLEEAVHPALINTGVGTAAGALVGNIASRFTYKKPDNEIINQEHEAVKDQLINKINSIQSELNQLFNFRQQFETGDPEATLVPIQKINAKIERLRKIRNDYKLKLDKLNFMTSEEIIRNHKKRHVRKGTAIGAGSGLAIGAGKTMFGSRAAKAATNVAP